jgi:hypothetical protein
MRRFVEFRSKLTTAGSMLQPLYVSQLFRLELQDPNARRRLRRLSQRLFTLSHVLDHIAQESVYVGPSTHGRSLLHS